MKTRRPYPTDLTDAQWERLSPYLPPEGTDCRPREVPTREVLDAYWYLLRAGCSWRTLPHDFPKWQTVYSQVRRWELAGVWEPLHARVREDLRLEVEGKPAEPSAAALGSQTVKAADHAGTTRGKKIVGRKRHVLVDMTGLLLALVVTTANVQDRDGAKRVLRDARGRRPRLRVIFADGGYPGQLVGWVRRTCGWVIQTVLRPPDAVGFVPLAKRWVVERTFGWLTKYRRLVKDYEAGVEMSEAMIYAAMTHRMLRRLCP